MKKYNFITKNYLIKEYVNNNRTVNSISKKLNCDPSTIKNRLIKYNIHVRNISEALKGHIPWNKGIKLPQFSGKNASHYKDGRSLEQNHCIDCGEPIKWQNKRCMKCESIRRIDLYKGINNPNYIDGRTPLRDLIRSCNEYKQWHQKIFKRDNYTCQECGQIGGDLEVHHEKSFKKLMVEFLKEYDQFSPLEDKETLVRLASKWQPFWDIDNGKTLCKDCHNITKIKIEGK